LNAYLAASPRAARPVGRRLWKAALTPRADLCRGKKVRLFDTPRCRDSKTDPFPLFVFIPKYVGARGWLGLWLDLPKIDWVEVEDVITEAYHLTAPKTLVFKLSSPDA
jgi:hypothetical protein